MRVFTVHARGAGEATGPKPATRLVREGFSGWAFLFGPLWLLRHGLWLALLVYLIVATAIAYLPDVWGPSATLAMQVLFGLHARDIQRWTLRRRGFAMQGVVAGRDEEEALLRLLSARPGLARGMLA